MINSLSIKWSHKVGYSRAWVFKKYWRNNMWNFLGLNKKQLKFSGSIKKKSQRIWFHSQEVPYNLQDFQEWSFVLSRISLGEIPNLEIPVDFSKKYVLSTHPFSGIAQFTHNKPISDEFLDHPFLHLLFVMTFSYKLFPSFQTKTLWCYELYVSWLGSYSCHDNKCQVHS